MWFKNIRAYRLTSPFALTPEQLGEQLSQRGFQPCAKSQALSLGWVPPLGGEEGELVHAAAGRMLIKLKREEKLLPSTVVREQLEEKVAAIEADQARKVYRKERLTLKDEIIQDCLPRAFTRSSAVYAYIDTRANWVFVDAASASRAGGARRFLKSALLVIAKNGASSAGRHSVYATPPSPARAVLPTLCTYVFKCVGASYDTTAPTRSTSSPRVAASDAISTRASPAANARSASARAACGAKELYSAKRRLCLGFFVSASFFFCFSSRR